MILKEMVVMKQFKDNRQAFNYYVLKSEWYKKRGDLLNSKKYLAKATEVKKQMEDSNSKKYTQHK